MIIGLSGKARSGKDTVAQMIQHMIPSSSQYNLADPLKACVNQWLGWGNEHGYGDQKETPQAVRPNFGALIGYVMQCFPKHTTPEQAVKVSQQMITEFEAFRHTSVHQLAMRHGREQEKDKDYFIVSPRQVYQWFGTEGMRQHVCDSIWLDLVPSTGIVILADIRFENEAEFCRNTGVLAHIQRKDCQEVAGHSSESGVTIDIHKDWTITNNSSFDKLRESVSDFVDNKIQTY